SPRFSGRMSLPAGPLPPSGFLSPAGVALSWHSEGKPAARFFAAASLLGVAALVTLGRVPVAGASSLFAIAGVALAAPALLVTLEISAASSPARGSEAPSARIEPEPARAAPPLPRPTPFPADRDREAELLHDLRSPLSVIRVYTDLIQEAARRGELPNPDYLSNLAREIELAESLVGVPSSAPPPDPGEHLQAPQNADLVEILGSLATAYRLAHGSRIRIEFIAERPQLPAAADPVALQR